MAANICWEPPVAVHVGEVKLPAICKHPPGLSQHGVLVWGQIDDAVGDDEVDAGVSHAGRSQVLDVAVQEGQVGLCIPQAAAEGACMPARHLTAQA